MKAEVRDLHGDGRFWRTRGVGDGWHILADTLDEARQLRDELTRVLDDGPKPELPGASASRKHPMRKPGGPKP